MDTTPNPAVFVEEVRRIKRVSDMLCTAHASLRDRYKRRSRTLDLLVLGLSTWLVALAFVDPVLNVRLTPRRWNPTLWTGLISVGVFFLTIVQLEVDWKGKADAHGRSLDLYTRIKLEAGRVLSEPLVRPARLKRILSRYESASSIDTKIPEGDFLKLKRRHYLKIAVSKRIDANPGTSPLIETLKLWWRDNFATDASRQSRPSDNH